MTEVKPRPTLRDLPLPAKWVITVFLMAVGLGYVSAMVQLHFKGGSKDGSPLPTIKDMVKRYSGQDWPLGPRADDKNEAQPKAEDKKDDVKKANAGEPVKKELASVAAGIKIKSLITERCAACHQPGGENEDTLLNKWENISPYLKPSPNTVKTLGIAAHFLGAPLDHLKNSPYLSKFRTVITGPEDTWGPTSMVRAFTDKCDGWKALIRERPEKEVRQERATENKALIAWFDAGARKEQYDADRFPLPPELAEAPLTDEFKIEPANKAIVKEDPKDPPPAKADVPKLDVGDHRAAANGAMKVKLRTLILFRCVDCHREEKKDTPLSSYADIARLFNPNPVKGKFHKVLTGPPNKWGKDSMVKAFFEKSGDWKKVTGSRPLADVKKEREMERLALIAWLEAGAPKDDYDADEFIVPSDKIIGPMTKEFLVGNPDPEKAPKGLKQIDLDSLVQSTHAHLLTFAILWALTGLVFAFTSYPMWLRCSIAPAVLLAQVLDVMCWWLARLPETGPYFAIAILGTGAIVGIGASLQILLSLFNMYGGKGKFLLLVVCVLGVIGLGSVYFNYVAPELTAEKQELQAAK
jgi:hypothetical protein